MVTMLAMVAPRYGAFNVTAKGRTRIGTTFDLRHAWPLLLLFLGTGAALLAAPARGFLDPVHGEPIIVASLWCVYNLVILTAALATALEQPQRRRYHRIERLGVARLLWPSLDEVNPWECAPAFSTDLSLGGVRLKLEPTWTTPDLFYVELYGDRRRPITLAAQVLTRIEEEGQAFLHCKFVDIDPRRQRELSQLIFSEPRSWLQDRYRPDRLLMSMWTVLVAPFTAFQGRPGRILRYLLRGEATQLIVPAGQSVQCGHCQAVVDPDVMDCDACGEPLGVLGPEAFRVPRPAHRTGWGSALAPPALAAVAVAVAIGWAPVTDVLSLWVPLELPDPVVAQAGLQETHGVLDGLRQELVHSVTAQQPTPQDFPDRLAAATGGGLGERLRADDAGHHLVQASRALASAAFELDRGLPQHQVLARLDSVDDSLAAASAALVEIRR